MEKHKVKSKYSTDTGKPKQMIGHNPDYLLALCVFALMIVGVIMISSASVVMSYLATGNNSYYLYHQLQSVAVGILCWIIAYRIKFTFWRKVAPWFLLINVLLLIAVFIPGIGYSMGGAQRWIRIGGISFQPSEALKLTFILYLAAWFEKKGQHLKNISYGTIPFIIMVGFIALLIMKQPNLSTMLIIAATAGIMFFVAGAKMVHITAMISLAAGAVWALIKSAPYRMSRLMIFLNPTSDQKGSGYHVNQALLAIGNGGLFGLGFGHSRQKYNYLPEAATDSIFAIIAEELGLIRTAFILGLFVFLFYRGYKIAKDAPDIFSRLVAIGITSWLFLQTFVNIGAMLQIIPLTGVPLPFVSYGGSSLILSLISVGILLNISKYTQGEQYYARSYGRWGNWGSRLSNSSGYRRAR